jgi:hypothetical protein
MSQNNMSVYRAFLFPKEDTSIDAYGISQSIMSDRPGFSFSVYIVQWPLSRTSDNIAIQSRGLLSVPGGLNIRSPASLAVRCGQPCEFVR